MDPHALVEVSVADGGVLRVAGDEERSLATCRKSCRRLDVDPDSAVPVFLLDREFGSCRRVLQDARERILSGLDA